MITPKQPKAASNPAHPAAKPPISPAARKLAEYLARRMLPKIEAQQRQERAATFDSGQ
jgi:hypothetical protein